MNYNPSRPTATQEHHLLKGEIMTEKNTPFDTWMQDLQIEWRSKSENHIGPELGWQNGGQYPWILPSDQWEKSLWPGIRTGTANSLPAYLAQADIQAHPGKHNLKSSWVLCANLYFPFRETAKGRALLANFLRAHVSPDVATVDELHLEYAEGGDLHPSQLLGESGGKRGSGQTSPDLAFHVNGHRALILIESKLTEHSFYPCSARRTTNSEDRSGNPHPERCMALKSVLADPQDQCHQCVWGRKYWNILRTAVDENVMGALKCCPAAHAGYQLFRQQALAEGIARGKRADGTRYDFVCSCVALDKRNEALKNCLKTTGIADLETGWSALFKGKARFKVFTHQQWIAWVKAHGDLAVWQPWLEYVTGRYGY
jgi:hypothetical protein